MPGAVAKKKRKDELSQEDRLLHYIEAGLAWAQLHTRAVVVGGVAVALLIGGIWYYRSYRENLRARAAIELNQMRATLTVADAVPRLTGFVARYDGTPSATEGRLLLARLQLQGGRPEAAIEALGPIASEPADLPSGYAVKTLLAEAYKDAGQYERAFDQLEAIIRDAYVPYQRHRALAEKGRLLAELGRLEEAAATYRRLVDEEDATDDLYRVRLGEIEALIASGNSPSPTAFAAPAPLAPDSTEASASAADTALPPETPSQPPLVAPDTADPATAPDSAALAPDSAAPSPDSAAPSDSPNSPTPSLEPADSSAAQPVEPEPSSTPNDTAGGSL